MAERDIKTYDTWKNLRQRCLNKNNPYYPNWGGRGIKVCSRWNSYDNFLKDMGKKPKNTTIDRIDNNGDYCKENCRWATQQQQANNTRQNRNITYNGITKTLSQWSRYFNIKRSTLSQRYYVYKWSINKCFNK